MVLTSRNHARRGFTLVETAMVLGLIGILMSAIFGAAFYISAATKLSNTEKTIIQVTNNYISLYATHGVDGVLNGGNYDVTCTGVNGLLFPPSLLSGVPCDPANPATTYPHSPFGASTYMTVSSRPAPAAVMMTLTGLTVSQCIDISNRMLSAPNVIYQAIGSSARWLQIIPSPPAPFTSAQIKGLCNISTTVSMMYKVRG